MSTKAAVPNPAQRARATGDNVILIVLAFFSLIVGVLVVFVYYLGAGMNAQMRMLPQMRPVALEAKAVKKAAVAPAATANSAIPEAAASTRPEGSLLVKRRNAAAVPEAEAKKKVGRFVVPLESFVVSMGGAGSHFLKLTLSAEVGTPETQAELETKKAEIRTALVSHFSGIAPGATKGVAAKKQLTFEAAEQIESVLKSGKVNRVYISEIVSR